MPWLALTLELAAETADGLGDALLAAGAHSVTVDEPNAARCALTALFAHDTRLDEALQQAAEAVGMERVPAFSVTTLEDEDWVRRTQSQFPPIRIGERLWLGPNWHEPPEGWPGAVVRIDPGLAFGTGTHPSTRLVLESLAADLRNGERVLDYGCGSGILAIAAAKLGASEVDAVDIDPQAIGVTAANAEANEVALRTCAPDALPPGVYDLVVANILAQPLILLAPLLAGRTGPGGRVALSGILETQAAEVAAAYAPFLAMSVSRTLDGWALVEGVRR
ncbi:MAG TPA: 50S ribosomal protein L11 methyltransferase [Burkholderiales bacterium]|nr:50S ribosomal protein L11 methyltransferase [Burkholderiales bacterium]